MAGKIITCLATMALVGTAAGAPLVPRQTCYSGIYMIVARGSLEPAGYGVTKEVVDLVMSKVPNSGSIAVDYPAAIISDHSAYPASVAAGINNAKKELHDYVAACGGHAKVALLGYSQGGNVMTDLLAGGVDKPAAIGNEYRSNIKAVTVFGDPTFTVGQSFDQGTATKSGIFARRKGGASLRKLNTYAGVLKSYCNKHDPFCASGDNLAVHLQEVQDFAENAASFIAAHV